VDSIYAGVLVIEISTLLTVFPRLMLARYLVLILTFP